MKGHRQARIAQVIREVASETILFQLRDPRVKMVTVTRVEVSGDLQHARVFVSIMGSERDKNLCLHALKRAAGYVQSKLADRLKTRFLPVIEFTFDKGLHNAMEVNRLLNEEKVRNGEAVDEPLDDETPLDDELEGSENDEDDELDEDDDIDDEADEQETDETPPKK